MVNKSKQWWERPRCEWYRGWVVPSRYRDSQRGKLYAAQQIAFPDMTHGPHPEFRTVKQMQRYVDKLTSYAWFRRRFGNRRIRVHDGRGRRRAGGAPGYITMPLWSRTLPTILHECAHACERWPAKHGPWFCRAYLDLVHHAMSPEDATRLKAAYRLERVRWKPYRDPRLGRANITPRFKAAACERGKT